MSNDAFIPEPLSIALLSNRELLEHHTPAGVTIDRAWRIVASHGDTAPFLGVPTAPPTYELMAVLREPLRDVVSKAIGRAITENRPVRVDDGWVDVDPGKRTRFSVTASPLRVPGSKEVSDGDGPAYIVLSFLTAGDVETAQLRAGMDADANSQLIDAIEKANIASEYAAKIVETLHEPLLVLNPDLTVRSASPSFFRDFKVTPETTVGRRIYELGNGQWNIPALRTLLEDVLPANNVFNDFEVRHDFEELGHRVMLVNARRLDHVQLILLGIRDVTPQNESDQVAREAQTQLQLVADRLRVSGRQFSALWEGVRDFAILLMDQNNIIQQWNAGATALMGWTAEEAVGQSASIIFTEEDRARAADREEMALALRDGRAPDERWHLRKDRSRFWGSGVMTAVRDEAGELCFVKVLRDVTEAFESERALEKAKNQAEAANRAKDEFLATLSHELRTPLSAVLIWTKLLRKPELTAGDRNEGLDAIEQSATAQKQLIDDLLDSSRITSGKLRLELTDFSLTTLVQTAVDTMAPTAQAKGIAVSTHMDPKAGRVRADADRIRQIVWNLLSNAVKFTNSGGKIEVGVSRLDSDVEIRVADDGKGIDAGFLPHVFDRFSQSDAGSTRTSGGLGLGLSITKQLVELHGGTITAESAGPNMGSTFRIVLPLRAVPR